ncbi:MAG: T9SS type A sorting domain-containing protein [Bacteroidota bacterium]
MKTDLKIINNSNNVVNSFLPNGGSMQRLFRLALWMVLALSASEVFAAPPIAEVNGRVSPGEVRVFLRDTLYRVNGTYTIGGTLIIEPGTTVEFTDNGRMIDSTGGRIIADGRMSVTYNNVNFINVDLDPVTPGIQRPYGFADPGFFLSPGVFTISTPNEVTVAGNRNTANSGKNNFVYNVVLDTTLAPGQTGGTANSRNRNLINLSDPTATTNSPQFLATPEAALLYTAARLRFANTDPNINIQSFLRANGSSVNITPSTITFKGRRVNAFSREYGHIVVLPGARAAFFRDVNFQDFRKDTTVDRRDYYQAGGTTAARAAVNDDLRSRSNGGGGALTSFSSRTWLVNCNFTNNFARNRGGALQLLEAPVGTGLFPTVSTAALPNYPGTANGAVTENSTGAAVVQAIPAIDNLATATAEPFTDVQRQGVDDARLAVLLGRVRQLNFDANRVINANVRQIFVPGVGTILTDDVNNAATFNGTAARNQAFGGAMVIAGASAANGGSAIEVALGVNNDVNGISTGSNDYINFSGNIANNLQNNAGTLGARGGALYVGEQTSVTIAGRFNANQAIVPFISDNPTAGTNSLSYSMGGAIYVDATAGRLQVRGGQTLDSRYPSHYLSNRASRGGAIFVGNSATLSEVRPSPIIGGSDALILTRNYGYNVVFDRNVATFHGGAIYAQKNMTVYGAGGVSGNLVIGYSRPFRVEFTRNTAGYSGGAITLNIDPALPLARRYVQIVRAILDSNVVGLGRFVDTSDATLQASSRALVRGGGAIYTLNATLNVLKGVEFVMNTANFSNGGAVAMVSPGDDSRRYMLTDLDQLTTLPSGEATTFTSSNEVFTNAASAITPPDARMLTRFIDNEAVVNLAQLGTGTTQLGDVVRTHPGVGLPENGTGLGGAIYILDEASTNNIGRTDSIIFNRVRIQNNTAFTGAAVYSDNYDLKLVFQRSLITNNTALSDTGREQNAITGPYIRTTSAFRENPASSDLAGAILYGEIIGPLPYASSSIAANSMYDNTARFLIRLPDAPNTKGTSSTGLIGSGGVDTLRGNYWGQTEAPVTTILPESGTLQETFFVAGDGTTHLRYIRNSSNPKEQGPFESSQRFNYTPIPVGNIAFDNQNTPAANSIPEKLLMQGRIYDLFDKGTDIKTADYSRRRMSPIEDFAVGIPKSIRRFTNTAGSPSFNRYVRRLGRDPFVAEVDANINALQSEFKGDQPIGYPLFLETRANYSGTAELSNQDHPNAPTVNETVFFVINETTGDFVRANLRQVTTSSEIFRGRIEMLPDSANRTGNTTFRRSAEGLANLGSGRELLAQLAQNGANEDAAALVGRRYEAGSNVLGAPNEFGVQFSNRPRLPISNDDNSQIDQNRVNRINFWAGERYRALPVANGDLVRVVSRTVLWNEGVNAAYDDALVFNVGVSTPPPVFTGNINNLRNLLPVELRNMIFVSEDRTYPRDVNDLERAPGRDSIFTISGVDSNIFYDPRSVLTPNDFTQLTYTYSVEPGSGLSYWLTDTTINASQGTAFGARGYRVLGGRPTNPFVVPGGEMVTVGIRNFPPNINTLDSLRAAGLADSVIARYINIFPPYFHAEAYDVTNARYLQQDTINVGANSIATYQFRVFVTDTNPIFTQNVYKCGTDEMLVANLTDKLRFQIDLQTDDEAEDAAAAARGWDFRYGKTAYGFQSIALRRNPTDSVTDEVTLVRPTWMSNQYFRQYGDFNALDPFGADFTSAGQLSIRIDSAQAYNLLTPVRQFEGALNTDTTVTFVVNDGHGRINTLTRRVMVNVAPRIENATFPDAIEDQDYNIALLDSLRRVRVTDPNFGQDQRFKLLYANDTSTFIPRDECFADEAGSFDVRNSKTAPNWLKIDPVSGILFGTPRVTDLPFNDTTVTFTVVVKDEGGLTDVRTFTIRVIAVNHPPILTAIPTVQCIEIGKSYTGTIVLRDIDLTRKGTNGNETVTITTESGFTVTPSVISGPQTTDSVTLTITATNFQDTLDAQGKATLYITATDKAGARRTISYKINVSQPTDFIVPMTISNSKGAFQVIEWGTAVNATTGESANAVGKLDSNYCEYELPPIPPIDVYDTRWTIPSSNGALRDIFPRAVAGVIGEAYYKGRFQAGDVVGNTSPNYPVTIKWNKNNVPAKTDAVRNPAGSSWWLLDGSSQGNIFAINMRTGASRSAQDINVDTSAADGTITVTIFRDAISNFVIRYDFASGVEDEQPVAGFNSESFQNIPNPFSGSTKMQFTLPVEGKVTFEIFDALGSKVADFSGFYPAGTANVIEWNAKDGNGIALPSGMYVARLSSGSVNMTRQMMIIR